LKTEIPGIPSSSFPSQIQNTQDYFGKESIIFL